MKVERDVKPKMAFACGDEFGERWMGFIGKRVSLGVFEILI